MSGGGTNPSSSSVAASVVTVSSCSTARVGFGRFERISEGMGERDATKDEVSKEGAADVDGEEEKERAAGWKGGESQRLQ